METNKARGGIVQRTTVSAIDCPANGLDRQMTRVVLPDLNLSARTAVEIRKDDESFEAWRKAIRRIDRGSRNDDPHTLCRRVEDELSTVKEQIEGQAFGSALKEHATRNGLVAGFTTAGQIGLENMVNGETNPVLALGAGAIGWICGAYLVPRAHGAGRVMLSLPQPPPPFRRPLRPQVRYPGRDGTPARGL